jgi:hypothetical protein
LKVFEGVTRVVFEGKSREELRCLMGENLRVARRYNSRWHLQVHETNKKHKTK